MTIPTLRRPATAWRFIVEAITAVTQPRADVAACDARVGELARESAIGRLFSTAWSGWRRASSSSIAVAASRRAAGAFRMETLVERVRALAGTTVVAMLTALALRVASTEHDPLTWPLPLAVLVIAAAALALARPIARAIEDRW